MSVKIEIDTLQNQISLLERSMDRAKESRVPLLYRSLEHDKSVLEGILLQKVQVLKRLREERTKVLSDIGLDPHEILRRLANEGL